VIGDDGGGTARVTLFGRNGVVLGDDPADDELPALWHTSDGGVLWRVTHPVTGLPGLRYPGCATQAVLPRHGYPDTA
jgi:hypothetical protein